MKKLWMTGVVLTLLLVGMVGQAGARYAYVDADGDGVCDHRTSCGYVDADGDGVCDHRTSCAYVDADGDGVCDHRTSCGYVDADGDGLCDRCGLQACVDADGDCRHCADGCQMGGTRPRDGSGMHRGHGGRHGGR